MTILYFVLAAAALGVLVFIHELGHYFMAKWMGMTVEVFSIGFGRPVLKWRVGNVDWQLGWLPFGGYVKIKGMEFGKKEKETYSEPYEIPDGFFAKAPWRRMLVAVAGPFANFILALLIFLSIWIIGGREKPFSEFTQIIGWVDPSSEIYAQGVRPGDLITEYDGKPFKSSKDLLYAAMLGGDTVELRGYHVNYATNQRTPFAYTVKTYPAPNAIDGIRTTGITKGARYLIYDTFPTGHANPLPDGSPMAESGIQYQDQLVWADGELLFSLAQLSHIINSGHAYLTIQRGDEIFMTRQPRVAASDLILPSYVKNELIDWQYETGIKSKLQDLKVLPFIVNSEGYVEAPLKFIDKESRTKAFPRHLYSEELEQPLEARDKILAVDGTAVDTGYDILHLLQTHKVQLMAKRDVPLVTKTSWKIEDQVFAEGIDYRAIQSLALSTGSPGAPRTEGDYVLLDPIEPKTLGEFDPSSEARERTAAEYQRQREEILQISDSKRRSQALAYLDQSYRKVLLGIYLQDRKVDYNPGPFVLFGSVFVETGQTLKALVTGSLHPKWISGPIGIVQVLHHGWKVGIAEALFWIGAISVNLGVLNLMPIPVLDGGYICLALWEMLTKRRLKARTMERIIIPFVVLLFGLLIFLTFQDLTRLF